MRLLVYLASEPGKMRTRRDLLTAVWDYHPDATSRTLDTHIKLARQVRADVDHDPNGARRGLSHHRAHDL